MRKMKRLWVCMLSIAVLLVGISIPAAGGITLRMTDWQAGCGIGIINSINEIIDLFEQANPGVKVEYQQYTAATYPEFLFPSIAAGTAPDIFAVYPGPDLATVVQADPNNMVAISDIWDEDWERWLGRAGEFLGGTVNGKLWIASLDAQTECIWVYKDLFEQCGVKVPPAGQPLTVDTLISMVEPANQLGYDLLTAGFMEPWVIHGYYFNAVHQLQPTDTPDVLLQAMEGEISWQQDMFALPIQAFAKMHNAGVWKEESLNIDYQVSSVERWVSKKAIGLWANGDWFVTAVDEYIPEENTPDNPNVVTIMYPLVNEDATPAYNWGFGTNFGINGKGAHKDLATALVRTFATPAAGAIMVKNGVVPAASGSIDVAAIGSTGNPIFDECLELFCALEGRASTYVYPYPEACDAIYTGVMDVMMGAASIDDVLAALDEVCGYGG